MGGARGRLVSSQDRKKVIDLITEASANGARKQKACEWLGVNLRTVERWQREGNVDRRKGANREVGNKLSEEERKLILSTLNSVEYRDLPPCQIVPKLADQDIYLASESSMYRILREEKQLTHRRLSQPSRHKKPASHQATGPNQIWSWDITYLPTQVRGIYFYLYMIMDVYSRKIIAWTIQDEQSANYAADLIQQACLQENIQRDQIVLHSDNGSPMKGATMLAKLETLGVMPSFSRPSVSDDNPFSEALFKTLKYHPRFPLTDKFETIFKARTWVEKFTEWYNNVHKHSGLKFITPAQRHSNEDQAIMNRRHRVYLKAKKKHPERWSGQTRNWELPSIVTLNANHKKQRMENEERGLLKVAI